MTSFIIHGENNQNLSKQRKLIFVLDTGASLPLLSREDLALNVTELEKRLSFSVAKNYTLT